MTNALVVCVGLLVAVRVGSGAGAGSSVATGVAGVRFVGLVGVRVAASNGGAGVGGLATGPSVDVGATDGAGGGSTRAVCTQLGVAVVARGPLFAAPPESSALAAARGVVVGRRRAVALLLLVAASEPELADGGKEEQESKKKKKSISCRTTRACVVYLRSNDRNGEACLVETAGSAVAGLVSELVAVTGSKAIFAKALASFSVAATERSVDNAGAAVDAITSEDGNGNESAAEGNIENHAQEGKDADAAEAWSEDDSQDGVYNAYTCDTLDGL